MKLFKKFLPLIITVIIILAIELSTGLISRFFEILPYQFNSNKYVEFIENMDCEKSTLCISDKNGDGSDYSQTDLTEITKEREFHNELFEKYKLNDIATADTDFEKTLQILSWLTENTYYSGIKMKIANDDSLDMLKASFGKSFMTALNCRNKAIVFSDCLVAMGINAYPVCMISMNGDCHFTCRVYISELQKWCAFDPSFNCWFSDENNNPLDVFEVRNLFLEGSKPIINDYNFNGTQRAVDKYSELFLRQCMSNLSTWDSNSPDNRDKCLGKDFKSAIPDDVPIKKS